MLYEKSVQNPEKFLCTDGWNGCFILMPISQLLLYLKLGKHVRLYYFFCIICNLCCYPGFWSLCIHIFPTWRCLLSACLDWACFYALHNNNKKTTTINHLRRGKYIPERDLDTELINKTLTCFVSLCLSVLMLAFYLFQIHAFQLT